MEKATVTIFNGMQPFQKTGRIVFQNERGLTIECSEGLRWFAFMERARIHKEYKPSINDEMAPLWTR